MITRKFLTTFLLSASCAAAHAEKPQAEYTVTRIAPYISQGFGINNAGATVGDDQFSGAGAHAFFTPGRDYTSSIDIGALESFDNSSIANDINDRFQVVGTSDTTSGQRGVLRNVDVFPPANTTATGINNAGQIVGNSNHLGPFIYRGRKMESLNALLAPTSRYIIRAVESINDRGQIVGYADEEGGTFAFAVRIDPCHIPADATGSGEAPGGQAAH